MDNTYVNLSVENNIATIEFYSPASNSLNSEQLKELADTISSCKENESISVIHLKSGGERAFCAGASFNELIAIDNLEDGEAFFMGFANVINAMRTCNKIIVTSIQGKTVGGGVGIAAASDYVIATEVALIKLSELTIGIGPFVIEPAVSKKIGVSNMTALSLDATEWKSATWAQEKGLFNKVVASMEELKEESLQFIQKLASYNPKALLEMKKVIWMGTDHWDTLLNERAKISGKLVLSQETKKALAKYK